ncbi:NHL domain-containing protein [Enhygromyxa salina]|uniref:Virginiamycin B lyase n=1 Tax=Enhygromyxa salina TaxID=215803 RepID=A0A2S9YS07_9BACT|nr:hypothetical protein [Enhygromyxa salina]PRQ07877.1 Virginiamycin B lyase [Enhygromyxa salina]
MSLTDTWARRLLAWTCALSVLLVAGCGPEPCEDGPSLGELCHFAGTGDLGFNRDGLLPKETDFFLPSAVRRGPDGLIYVMDFNNQRFRRIGEDGRFETVVGSGFHAIASVDLPASDTPLENPIDFAFLSDDRPVFVSYHDPRVLVLADDGTLDAIAGAADGVVGTVGDEGDGGPAVDALFIQLDGIAVTPDDTIYVSDSLANRVRKIEAGVITTVAGTGEPAYSGDGGPGAEAALHWPTALELDPDGNLYIVDTFNHAIRRLAPDGSISTVVGSGVEGSGGDGGPATQAQLNEPFGLARDEDGTLYVGDRSNFRVRRVDPDGIITTIAGTGVQGPGQPGPATQSTLGFTARIALDGTSLLVVDQSNSKIWRVEVRAER